MSRKAARVGGASGAGSAGSFVYANDEFAAAVGADRCIPGAEFGSFWAAAAGKTLPLPCVPTAFVTMKAPFLVVLRWGTGGWAGRGGSNGRGGRGVRGGGAAAARCGGWCENTCLSLRCHRLSNACHLQPLPSLVLPPSSKGLTWGPCFNR